MQKLIFALISLSAIGRGLSAADQSASPEAADQNWHQAAGPNFNWQIVGEPPLRWSATRGEHIRWRTPMPEAGMSSVTVWEDRAFTTTHVPIEAESQKNAVKHVLGFCLDAETGKVLWQVTLPGSVFISLAGGFTDGTVFAPITDGKHVWFFNRCGSIGCYDLAGNRIWLREWTPRFKHNNRQCEPMLVGDAIVYLEVANKSAGAKLQKWKAPGVINRSIRVPDDVDVKEVWTYLHGIDKRNGKTLWRETVGTSVHTTPVVGRLRDGSFAVSHARGGGHGPLEKPYGHSLTSLAPGQAGRTIWSTPIDGYDPSFSCHMNEKYAFGFSKGRHLVFDITSGKILREQALYTGADLWKRDVAANGWTLEKNAAVRAGKSHPNTNQANIVIGDWHWFLSHNVHYLGRVHVETGRVEYLELPAQLIADRKTRDQDQLLWGRGRTDNRPTNARGFAVGDKGHNGTGWGHISAASPTLVGRYLLIPVVTGTVHVIDTSPDTLSPKSIVSTNDLGPAGETWSLASLSFSRGKLFAHTMREVLCIGDE